jgi:hypothetical protein
LNDAIDANRNRATGQTGGTGLQKAGRPTGTQGTGSGKTTQTSSRTGGGSVLSQAIDQARSGETVERATGVQLPQSFRGLTDTQRSGVSTTPSASSLFQNRFNRDGGGSRTATTTQRRTTAGGFYSMPDFGAESQRLESVAKTAQSAMQEKETEMKRAYSAMTELEKSAQFYGQQAQSIYETYLQNQDPTWGSLFERASANYERVNQEYSAAADTFNALYSEYEPLLNSYNQAAEAYNQYVGSQQEAYSAWRNTIRSQDAIQQDITAADASIQALEEQKRSLNATRGGMNQMQRRGGLDKRADIAEVDRQIEEIDAQVEDLEAAKTLLQEELEWSQYFRYADLTQAEDFGELSQYRSTANGREPEFNAWSGMYTETGFNDIDYDIINRNEEAMGHQMVNDVSTNASFLGLDNGERRQMTDEEIAIFNYLYAQDTARGDTAHSTAYGYIDYLTGDLNYRQRQADEQAWAAYAKESPVGSSVFSVITSPLKGLSYLGQAADYLADGEIDQNAGYNKFSYMNSAIRDEVTGIVEDKWGGVGSFAYNTGMSMADFLFNTAVSGGNQAMALAIMGTGAAADTTIDAKDRGLSDGQAFALGTIAGAAEIVTEKFSLDRLLKADWEKGALRYILGNAFTEGTEEVGSDIINLTADILISKDKSEWQTSINAYMEQGMSEGEAVGKAVADQAMQMGLDFLGGAISGGVMSGGASVGNAVSTYNTGRALNNMNLEEGDLQAIIQEGLDSDPSTRSHREAVKLQQQMQQGKTPGTYQLGSLYRANIRAIDAEQQGEELLQRARKELEERGSVRNGTARSILENVNAVNTLTAQAGLNLTEDMSQQQRREAVKQAVNNFSPSTETDVETGSDTGAQPEGVVLPTAEDLENQNRQAAEVRTDTEADITTEPGMLPTAAQLETQRRLERASTDLERSGIQAGAREENIQAVQRLSDILGRNIRFYDGRVRDAGDPSGAANGYYDLDEDTIYVNSRSRNPVAQIVSHELTHSVETADAYADLSDLVLNRIQQTGGNLEQLRREKAELYARRGARLPSQKAIDQEIVANYVERYLLTDEQSIRELTQQNRSLGQRILAWLNELLAKLGNASAQERAFLTQARDTYARALQQTQTSFSSEQPLTAPSPANAEAYAGRSSSSSSTGTRSAGLPVDMGENIEQAQQTRPAEETGRAAPEAAQEGRRRQPVSEDDQEAQRRRSETQDALEGLREDYAAGRITEEEFDAAMDAIMEQEGLAGEEMLEQYSIDENYERDIDDWDAQGRPDGEVFILGSTGDVLQGLGAMEQDIYLRSEKVNSILQQHSEMTLAEIKRIPEILDDPVLVLKSRNVGRGGQQNTRLVLFGTVRAENGQPVLAVLDLRPVENGLAIDDMQKVTSSYTKDSNPVWYVQNSDILHADKNRTIPLLRTIGFQMPIELQRSGSMGSISYHRQNVNIQGVPFEQVVDTTRQQEDGRQYSFGGRNANAADLDALNRAQELERQGVAMDTIFRETGWYTGADGKWRFEIDDSGMEYSRWGDLRREDRAEYARFRELEGKFIDGSITMDEQNELRQLLEEGHGAGRAEEQQTLRLPDFVRHDELYQNYPQLRQAGLRFARLPEGTRGTYDGQDIVLDESLRSAPEDTLVHEIQHAIQRAEGFTGGASPEGWQAVRQQVIDTVAGARQNLDLWLQDIGYQEYVRESMNRVVSGEITLDEHWKALEEFKKDSPFAAEIARCEEELANYENQLRMLNNLGDGEWGNSFDMYENTAGEIEARDVTARRQMTPEQRRETMPNTGDERTVFAETMQELGSEYGMWDALPEKRQFSMSEPVEQTRDLLALHNLTQEKLRSTLQLGGFPMPSIAVIRDQMQHDNYGEITMVFGRDTIDPQADSRNRVYGGDAWTPTAPRVDYPIDYQVQRAFENRVEQLSADVADGTFSRASVLGTMGFTGDGTDLDMGEIARRLADNNAVQAAYLAEQGRNVEPVMKAKQFDSFGNDSLDAYIDRVGEQEVARLAANLMTGERLTNEEIETAKDAIMERWTAQNEWRLNKKPELRETRIAKQREKISDARAEDFIRNAWDFFRDSGATTDEVDFYATRDALEAAVDKQAVADWTLQQLDGLLGEPGIYNGRDPFTSDGRSRSFQQLHYPYTLENLVKAMSTTQEARGEGLWGATAKGLQAVSTPEYRNVEEIHADEGRLQNLSQEEYDALLQDVDDGINQVIEAVRSTNEAHSSNSWEEADIIGSVLIDAARGRHTPAAVQRAFRKEDYTISRELAQQIVDLFNQAANVPTGYFEAKPQRAVPLDEILAAVVPDTMDAELRSELEGAGVPTITYPEGDTQRRMEAVNSVEGAKFSISEEEDAAPERRDTQEDERVFITPRGVEVVRNPTDQEYQQMRDEAYQDYPWLWGTGEPVLRHTYDRQGNEYYWRADQAVHAQVEPYINQRYGTQTSQQWQWWTREDADEWPTDYGRQYSVDEEAELPTAAQEESRDIIGTMPVKAQQYLRRAESYLTAKVGNLLSVPRYAQREYLRDIVREISLEYLREGRVSDETINDLFDRAYDEGVVVDREFYDQYEELRNFLRTTQLTISPEDSADISDFNDFRKSNFGRLNISTQGGTNIDRVYQELESMWPEFFSEARESHPSDQLQRIADVAQSFQVVERNLDEYYGPEAAEFRRWARHDFEAAVNDALSELNRVRRYVQERDAQAATAEAVPTTQAEVTEMWGQLKQARRTYEKTAARNLLTQHDQVQVGRLLRGEIELEHLNEKTDNVKGIREVYQAKLEYERLTRLIRQWNQSRKAALRQQADRYLQTANDWKDKKAGILYSRETMERNIRDIVKDATLAEEINQTYFTPVHDAAAAANRMKNQYRDRVRDLNLSRNVAKGNTVSEAHAVQLLGEAEDNIRILEQSRGRLKERDGKSLEDWRGIVNDLWEENPNLDAEKIRAAVAQFRTIYDELFQQMNEVRVRNGYEPVNYRSGYFPHFQPGNGDGILARFGKALGIDTEVTALPTTINGLTHTFRPGIRWFGNAQERLGFNTAYDAVEGFDRYIEGVADVIHQTDNIQRLRALASQARYRTGDEGIRKQVDEVRANPNLTEEDKQNRIEKIYETGRFALSNFVVELEEYTNLLANKKSRADRNMEQALGRNMYNLVKALEGRVAANMVAVNPASWLTNFIPLTQGGALLDRGMLLKGMWDTLKAYKVDDGIVDKSSFLTNRRGSDPLVRTWAQKASATASRPMEYIDHFVADSLVRARYRQNLGKNMSEDAAMSEADAWVAGVMADRSKGSTPTLFNRSNPITKVFTQFQLEVNNQLSYLFKDMPKDVKDKGIAALAAALLKFFLGAWLFDEVYEYVIGRRPALDPIGILNDTVGDLTGYELPNLVELGVGAVSGNLPSFEVEQTGLSEAGSNLAGTVAETLPFIGGVLGGGRVPISSAIPNLGNLWNALTNEDWSAEKRLQEVRDELLEKPLVYLGLPFGGGQLKKIYEGIEGVIQGGSYSVNAEGEQELQYPIYNDTPAQAVGNAVLASTFGRTSLPTGRDWIEGGFDTLGAKQTAVYQGLLEAGVPGEEAYALLEQLRGVEKTETESEAAQERRLLQEADISGDGKSIVYYGLMASDRERELMDELADMDADMGEVTTALLGIKDAGALKGAAASNAKRDAIAGAALSEDEQIRLYNYTFGEKQDDGSYVSSRAEDITAFQEAGLTFDQFLEAQNEYSTINEEYDSSGEKAVEFARWVNGQGLTEEQAAVVKDAFTYYSQIPQSGGYYEKFAAAGMSDESAYSLNQALDELEPLEGEDQVTSLQKYQVVVNSDLTESEQMTAMGELMPETEYEKLRVGSLQGVTPRAYVSYKQALPLYDADGNGSFKQEEVRAALDSLPLTTEQRAALWQMQNKSWKPSSNPYSVSVSQQVYDALNAEEEDDGGLMDWSSGVTLPTAEELEQNGLMNWN